MPVRTDDKSWSVARPSHQAHVRRAFDHLPGVRLVNGYGPTENTTFTCCHVIRREDVETGRTIPIGRPIANTTVHVLDSDGRLAPIGVPGELVAGGDGVALGYIGQPELTQQSFLTDTFSQEAGARLYRSGDRVRWRPDGLLEFLGRFDNQVKIRGYRVEPDEVAACIAEHECVRQAVVVPNRAASGSAQLLACVVPKSEDYSAPELRKLLVRHTAERLPPHMVPARFLLFRELPLKPNGKLDLAALEDAKDSTPVRADAPLRFDRKPSPRDHAGGPAPSRLGARRRLLREGRRFLARCRFDAAPPE